MTDQPMLTPHNPQTVLDAAPDRLTSTGALTSDEHAHLLAIRPDWSPIWDTVERLFARADATFDAVSTVRAAVWPELEGEGF